MKKVTNAQLQKIHVLLRQLNLVEQKESFVFQFSNGRSFSSRDLTMDEATLFIQHLSKFDSLDRMRKKVFALAYEAGIIWGDTDDKKMNAAKLSKFLKERGTVRKELNSMTKDELVKVVTQFELIVKHQASSQENKAASKLTSELLAELNIETQNSKR